MSQLSGDGQTGEPQPPLPPPFPTRPPRSGTNPWVLLSIYVVALAGSVALIILGGGVFGSADPQGSTTDAARTSLVAAGALGVVLVMTLGPLALILVGRSRGRGDPPAPADPALLARMDDLIRAVHVLREQSALSDDARRALNRHAERDYLRSAIEDDISAEEWEPAAALCRELSDRFGFRADADDLLARIEKAKTEAADRHLRDAVARIDGYIVQRRWSDAAGEVARTERIFGPSARTTMMRQRVDEARAAYKADLESKFVAAARAELVDEAMSMLRELDGYLTEQEAASYRELARDVVAKARDALGTQFRQAVEDARWADAAGIGRRIIADFPNSRMAGEVRDLLDGILQRANAPAAR